MGKLAGNRFAAFTVAVVFAIMLGMALAGCGQQANAQASSTSGASSSASSSEATGASPAAGAGAVARSTTTAGSQSNSADAPTAPSASSPATGASASGAAEAIAGNAATMLSIDDPVEQAAVRAAVEKVRYLGRAPKVIATSPACVDICDKLELDLVGVGHSSLFQMPARYEGVTEVGPPMNPDMEIVGSLSPDWVLSPNSLQADLQPKYKAVGCDYAFLNLKSVQGMYRSIQELGEIFDRRDQARSLVDDFTRFYTGYQTANASKTRPRVLILMGMPGSYVIATPNSYVGNLVELAGGENVYAGATEDFLTVNTEDMQTRDPDVILRCSHALPDQVMQMFAEEFQTNDIWKHFRAVQDDRVYDLPYDLFGMSATFDYPEALELLQDVLYET